MSEYEFQEEEFTTQFNGRIVARILAQTKPHWPYLVLFLIPIGLVSLLDSYFTFLSKRIIDEGIVAQDQSALIQIIIQYGALIVVQAAGVFGFIYFTGILGEKVRYDLRKKLFNHLQALSLSYYSVTRRAGVRALQPHPDDRADAAAPGPARAARADRRRSRADARGAHRGGDAGVRGGRDGHLALHDNH